MRQPLLFSILIGLGTQTFAQTTKPEIITDRPDQTEAPSLVPTGGIQVKLDTVIENDAVEDIKVTNYKDVITSSNGNGNGHAKGFDLKLDDGPSDNDFTDI